MAAGAPLPRPPAFRQPRLLRRLLSDPQPVLDELRREHGPIVGLGAGPMRTAVVGDPTALRELFGSPTQSFRWGHRFNVLGFVVGEGSMIVSDGDDWKRRRSSVQAAFSRRRLNGWIPTIVERTDAHLDAVEAALAGGTDVVDLARVGRLLVLEIVVRALFGERLAARSEEIGDLFQRSQAYLESPAVRQLPHPFPRTRRARVRADRRALDDLIDGEIADRRANPTGDPLDVIEALVVDGTLTDAEIRDQVVTLMGAGFDTTSASLAWMVWCTTLAGGDLWARLRAEADEVFPASGPVGETHLARLDLAARTMRETTRLHPAGVISPRQAAVDVTVGGYRIPKGTLVLWSAHLAAVTPRRGATRWRSIRTGSSTRRPSRRPWPTWHGCRSAAVPATASGSRWRRWS